MDEGNRFQAEDKNNLGTFSAINKIECRTIFSFITISKQILFLSKKFRLCYLITISQSQKNLKTTDHFLHYELVLISCQALLWLATNINGFITKFISLFMAFK